jgi:hypothetical protein
MFMYMRDMQAHRKMENSMFRDIRIAPPLQASSPSTITYITNKYLSLNACLPCLFNAYMALECYPCFRPCLPSYVDKLAIDALLPTAKQYYSAVKSYNRKQLHPAQRISFEEVAGLLRDSQTCKTVGEEQAIEGKLSVIHSAVIKEMTTSPPP